MIFTMFFMIMSAFTFRKLPATSSSVFSVLRTSACVSVVLLVPAKEKRKVEDGEPMSDDQTCPNRHSSQFLSFLVF